MLNLEEFRSTYPQYNDMTDYELSTALHRTHYADMPYEQFARSFGGPMKEDERILQAREYNARHPEAPIEPREIGQGGYLNDLGHAFAAGLNDLASLPFWAGEKGAEALGWDTAANLARSAKDYFKESADAKREGYSADMKLAQDKQFVTEDAEGNITGFGSVWSDPRAVSGMIAESLPSMAGGMGIGAGIAKSLIARGMSRGLAWGIGSSIGEGSVAGAQDSQSVYDAVMKMPEETLARSPEYQELLRGMSPEEARKKLADSVAFGTALQTGFATGVLSAPAGALFGRMLGGETGKTLLRSIGKQGVAEGLEETAQSGAEQYLQQNQLQRADQSINPSSGVANAAVAGGLAGMFMGGGMAVPGHMLGRRRAAESAVNADAGATEQDAKQQSPTIPPVALQPGEFNALTGPEWNPAEPRMHEAAWNREAAARGWRHLRTDVGTSQPQEGVARGISMALENGDNVDLLQPDNHFSAQQPKTTGVQPTLRPDFSPLYHEDMDRVLAMRDSRYAPSLEERATAALEQRKMPYQGPSSTPFMEASGFTPQGMLAPQVTSAQPISLGIGFMQDRPTPSAPSVQAVPAQAQITNTQTAPRADTMAQADALGMPAPEAVPREAQPQYTSSAVPTLRTRMQLLEQLPLEMRAKVRRAPTGDIRALVEQMRQGQSDAQAMPAVLPERLAPATESGVKVPQSSTSTPEEGVVTLLGQQAVPVEESNGQQQPERAKAETVHGLQQGDSRPIPERAAGNATGAAEGRSGQGDSAAAETSGPRKAVAVKIPNHAVEAASYELLEVEDIQASHLPEAGFQKNPGYQLENERRYHDEPASQAKVLDNAQKLDPSFLIDSVDANHGAPVIDRQGNVLGGNGRAMSVRLAYDRFPERAANYRQAIRERAASFGLNPVRVDEMRRPVLVRRLDREMDAQKRQALVAALNDTFTDSKNARASGKSRGDRLSRKTLEALGTGMAEADSLRQYFDEQGSAAVVEMLVKDGVIQKTERNAYIGPDGLLNPDGKRIVEEALRGRVARSYDALASLPGSILAKIDAAIPHLLTAEGIGGAWNITDHMRDAVDLMAEFRASGEKMPETFLNRMDMLKGQAPVDRYSQAAQELFLSMNRLKKADFVQGFAKFAGHAKLSMGMGVGKNPEQAAYEFLGIKLSARAADAKESKHVDLDTGRSVERDSQGDAAQNGMGEKSLSVDGKRDGSVGGGGGRQAGGDVSAPGGEGLPGRAASAAGTRRDPGVGEQTSGIRERPAGGEYDSRGRGDGRHGLDVRRDGEEAVGKTAERSFDERVGTADPHLREVREGMASLAPGQYLPRRRDTRLRLRQTAVQNVADALGKTARNAAPVRVVQHFEELPAHIRQRHAVNAAALEGVYDPGSRVVWLVADNLTDTGRVAEVWAHEQIVHHGLRGLLSDAERKAVLNRLWFNLGGMSNGTIKEIADKYGLNPRAEEKARLTVMEEVIASLAEKRQEGGLDAREQSAWRKIVHAVLRAWSRLVHAVSGRSARISYENVDALLADLGRFVMEGAPRGRTAENAAHVSALASVGKDGEAAGRAAWEQAQKDTQAWGRQLDGVRAGSVHSRQVLTVGRTPRVLQKLGAPDLAMTMTQSVLRKIKEGGKHDLPDSLIRNLPALLAEPVMVFKSGTQADSLVALLEAVHDGMPVVAAVHLDVARGSVNINEIASVHGRSGGLGWVAGEIRAGRRVYADKRKIPAWQRGFAEDPGSRRMSGLQLPGAFVLPNDPRGIKILTEKDVVKPVAPKGIEEDDAPLASLSARDILGMTLRGAAKSADASEIRHLFRKNDISLLQSIIQLPHWIAKQAPDFAKVYERQLRRMDERSAALKKSLESVPGMFGKDRLKAADMDSLRKILWETEGMEPKELEGVEKFLSEEKLATGRELIKVNPEFYDAYQTWLDGLDGTRAAKAAMLEIRKSLDHDLVLAHNRMAAMSEMSDDAITEFRQSIGHVPNYFPHHRYGAYFVQAKAGNAVVFRQHFDALGEKAAIAKARKIVEEQRENYPGAEWTDGKNDRLPDEVLGAPIDSEAMEQIIRAATAKIGDKERAGEIADLLTEGVADVLKARGWGAHGIRRKGIPGFETRDIAKVLYDYKAGLNGWLTKMEAACDFSQALSQIDARQTPNLWKYTAQYVKDMLRNSDRVDRITGNIKAAAFAWYLGGSIKTAFVNATQNLVVGVPRLQMDVTGGGREWLAGARSALVDRVTGNKGKGLTEDESRLVRELGGEKVITDAYMEEVRGQLSGVSGASLWNKFTSVLGWPMSEVERFNRASLALAAFRAARSGKLNARAREKYGVKGKAGYEQAKAFAADVVRDAHFVYGKSNMPEFMRSNTAGRAMSSMYTFRTFTHNMIAMWSWALRTQGREGAAFVAKSLGATMALGGVTALPLYATLMALFQAVTGDDDDWTELIRSRLPESNLLRDVVCYGAPAMAGVNIGGSLKMETGLTRGLQRGSTPQEVLTDSLGDIVGIPYDLLVVKPSRMMEAYRGGSVYRAVEEASPVIMKNAMQAWRLYAEGQTTMKGRSINSPGQAGARKLTQAEMVGKALGFQPVSSTKSYEAYAARKHADAVRSDKLNQLTVLALKSFDTGTPDGRIAMMKELRAWNKRMQEEGKPHMLIQPKDVLRRVKSRRRENRATPRQRQKGAAQMATWGV